MYIFQYEEKQLPPIAPTLLNHQTPCPIANRTNVKPLYSST